MLKKIALLSILAFLLCFVGCSNNKNLPSDVPANLQLQYKKEMESIINKSIPKARKAGEESVKIAKNYRDTIIINKLPENAQECYNLSNSYDYIGSVILLQLFADLVKASGKYFKVDYTILQTDWWGGPADYIEPYLIKNNVNMSELSKLEDYASEQSRKIVQYIKDTEQYCHIYSKQSGQF